MQKNIFNKKFVLGLVIILFGISVLPGVSGDWPMFGHDLGHTRSSTSSAPNTNYTKWIFSTNGSVESSPTIVDDKVYVGSYDGKIYCLNASTGNELWNFDTVSNVSSSAAIVDNKVYVGAYNGKIYCLNASEKGSKIWEFPTGGYVHSSPAVFDDKVYIGSSDGKLYCLNASLGNESWNHTTGGEVGSSPAVAAGKVYVGSSDNNIYCLYTNGTLNWNYSTNGSIISSPAVVNGKVYFGSKDWKVYCLDANSGSDIWNESLGGSVNSSPAVWGGNVYIGSNDSLYCLDADTGDTVWSNATGDTINWSSPAVADGKVYISSSDRKLYCFNAVTGAPIWNYTTNDLGWSSPAVADGKVYVGSHNGSVYCFGNLLPVANFNFEPVSPLKNQTVYFNSTSFDSDGFIVNWTWDFGDGNFSYFENATHQYVDYDDYIVNLTVKDNEDATDSVEQVVSVINSLPVANFTIEPVSPFANQTVFFNSTSSDVDGFIVNWTWDMDDGTILYGEQITHQYVDDGDYTVNLTVKDDENDVGSIEQVVSIGNLAPYEPSNPIPTNGSTGISISADLSWIGGDPNYGDTVTYDVYFGTTNPPTTNVSNNQTATTYNLGTLNYNTKYYWKIVAWDSNNTTTSGPIWQFTTKSKSSGGDGGGSLPNNAPIADANGPYNEIINNAITFDGSGSNDSDGTIVSYDWTFGDGTIGKGESITHSYTAVGNYTVKLTVTDNGGQKDSDTTYAVISDKPNSPPDKPSISGNVTGKKNTNYNYNVISIDQDDDNIKYVFDWDDGTNIMVTDFVQNATAYNVMHSWANPGVYTVKVIAVDEHNYSSETAELIVLIDTYYCGNIGYIIDTNSDGIYDLFHSYTTGNETEIKVQNGGYLIDSDEDGKWDFTFDLVSGLSVYQEEEKDEETPGFELILILCAIALLLFLKRKNKLSV